MLALLVGCATIGDSGARIRGQIEVRGRSEVDCLMSLHVADSDVLVGTVKVKAKFEKTFVLAPGEDDYYVTITCQGISGQFKSAELRLGSVKSYRQGIDLGRVTLDGGGEE